MAVYASVSDVAVPVWCLLNRCGTQFQQRLHIQPLRKPFITLQINVLLKFCNLYFNNFILPRPKNLYVILARHNELPEDDILYVETCRSALFIIVVFDIIVHSLVKL